MFKCKLTADVSIFQIFIVLSFPYVEGALKVSDTFGKLQP